VTAKAKQLLIVGYKNWKHVLGKSLIMKTSMFLLYRLNLGAPIWPIEVGGPRILPVWAHSIYATGEQYHRLDITIFY
jgi:hypothetical protein